MPKVNYRQVLIIPTSKNFSDLELIERNKGTLDAEDGYDVGDAGKAAEQMLSNINADAVLLDLLFRFEDRDKVILLYQLMRESGYNLNHADCAKTLSVTREHYMFLLKQVKRKARKVLQEPGV